MRILVTGNMGYVGPVVVRRLRAEHPDSELIGCDLGLFSDCALRPGTDPEAPLDRQVIADVRDLDERLLEGLDAVVHLAAISNDPMGNRFEAATLAINHRASVELAGKAARAGVGVFVFASSCSVYGASADGRPRSEADPLSPLTAYARSKIATEEDLARLDLCGMAVRSLRFATACGMAPRLRLDLVLNDFVAGALASGRIEVLSDGTPWRPLIDVEDMARAIDWAVTASQDAGPVLAINVGRDDFNWQVRDLAEAVAAELGDVSVSINARAQPDTRSYRVDFRRFAALAPQHQPIVTLTRSIGRIAAGLREAGFSDRGFRDSRLVRLKALERLVEAGVLDAGLRRTEGLAEAARA